MTQMQSDAALSAPVPAPSLSQLLTDCNAALDSVPASSTVTRQHLQRIIDLLTSCNTTASSSSAAAALQDVGYELLDDLLPLISPASIAAASASPPSPLSSPLLSGCLSSLLMAVASSAPPRELLLPLLSHLSSHLTSLSSPLSPQQEAESLAFVRFLLPACELLMSRESHRGRADHQWRSLYAALLVPFLSLCKSDAALSVTLTPAVIASLSPSQPQTVSLALLYLAAYLPHHYPLPSSPHPLLLRLLAVIGESELQSSERLLQLQDEKWRAETRLRQLRSEAWEVTEEEEQEMGRREQETQAQWDDDDDDAAEAEDAKEEKQETVRQRRRELRQVKAQLSSLPPYTAPALSCFLLVRLQSDRAEVQRCIASLSPQETLPRLMQCVTAMLEADSAALKGNVGMVVELMSGWLEAAPAGSVLLPSSPPASSSQSEAEEAAWMLAQCITTSMMQPQARPRADTAAPAPAVSSHLQQTTSVSSSVSAQTDSSSSSTTSPPSRLLLLSVFLSRFSLSSRCSLTQQLIVQCPIPAIQAILISSLKDCILQLHAGPPPPPSSSPVSLSSVLSFLLSLLTGLSSSYQQMADPLISLLNLLRLLLLLRRDDDGEAAAAAVLDKPERESITTAVRLLQRSMTKLSSASSAQDSDLVLSLLQQLAVRVLELS